MKAREPRYRVMLPAQMRWDGPWVTGSVRNVSGHGLMICSPVVPPLGAYVELQVGSATVTARSVWSSAEACGLRSRSALDFARLREPAMAGQRTNANVEFRGSTSPRARASSSPRLERSRQLSYAMQYATALAVGLLVAGSISWEVYHTLAAPASRIAQAMGDAK